MTTRWSAFVASDGDGAGAGTEGAAAGGAVDGTDEPAGTVDGVVEDAGAAHATTPTTQQISAANGFTLDMRRHSPRSCRTSAATRSRILGHSKDPVNGVNRSGPSSDSRFALFDALSFGYSVAYLGYGTDGPGPARSAGSQRPG